MPSHAENPGQSPADQSDPSAEQPEQRQYCGQVREEFSLAAIITWLSRSQASSVRKEVAQHKQGRGKSAHGRAFSSHAGQHMSSARIGNRNGYQRHLACDEDRKHRSRIGVPKLSREASEEGQRENRRYHHRVCQSKCPPCGHWRCPSVPTLSAGPGRGWR